MSSSASRPKRLAGVGPLSSNVMRAYAYPVGEPVNQHGLVELKEFSISADAASIRALANFMLAAADQMDSMGDKYDHLHAQDMVRAWDARWPDLVICRPVEDEF